MILCFNSIDANKLIKTNFITMEGVSKQYNDLFLTCSSVSVYIFHVSFYHSVVHAVNDLLSILTRPMQQGRAAEKIALILVDKSIIVLDKRSTILDIAKLKSYFFVSGLTKR